MLRKTCETEHVDQPCTAQCRISQINSGASEEPDGKAIVEKVFLEARGADPVKASELLSYSHAVAEQHQVSLERLLNHLQKEHVVYGQLSAILNAQYNSRLQPRFPLKSVYLRKLSTQWAIEISHL